MTDSPPPLFTLTGNLLAERTLTFPAWSAGRTQRATAETFQVGGKGINVAKMLTRLGAPNSALGFTGGATGEECTTTTQDVPRLRVLNTALVAAESTRARSSAPAADLV